MVAVGSNATCCNRNTEKEKYEHMIEDFRETIDSIRRIYRYDRSMAFMYVGMLCALVACALFCIVSMLISHFAASMLFLAVVGLFLGIPYAVLRIIVGTEKADDSLDENKSNAATNNEKWKSSAIVEGKDSNI